MQNKQRFHGVIPPTITPLHPDETLDTAAVGRLVEHCLAGGVSGLFVNGTSGEAMRTTDAVWRENMQATLRFAAGRVPVFCGAIEASTARVLQKIRLIEEDGGSTAVVTPPFYLTNFGQDEILRHYDRICNATKLEIAVYNIPETTGANILPETVAQLAAYENVVVYKDSTANWQQLQRALFALEGMDIAVFNGAEELCAVAMLFGADGCIPGLANFVPELFVRLCEAGGAGKLAESYTLQKQVRHLREAIFVNGCWVSGMKHLASHYGFGGGALSQPLAALSGEEMARAQEILTRYGGIQE